MAFESHQPAVELRHVHESTPIKSKQFPPKTRPFKAGSSPASVDGPHQVLAHLLPIPTITPP